MDAINVAFDESIKLREKCSRVKHAAHCFLYYKEEHKGSHGCYTLMQMRFDGKLGFPGGEVDVAKVTGMDDVLDAMNRELLEEINFDCQTNPVTSGDYLMSQVFRQSASTFVAHFFGKELTKEQFDRVERGHMNGIHFPSESLGLFRVPIISLSQCQTSKKYSLYRRFWTNFAHQQFAGNAFHQLTAAIKERKLLTERELSELCN